MLVDRSYWDYSRRRRKMASAFKLFVAISLTPRVPVGIFPIMASSYR